MAVNRVQSAFRFRVDTTAAQGGSPVWGAAQNVNYSPPLDTPFRLRFQIENTGSTGGGATTYNILVSRNGGAYAAVPTTASGNPVFCIDATGGASADKSAISTAILTGASGTFVNGQYSLAGATSTITLGATTYSEVEFGLQFNSAVAVPADTYAFRVYFSGSSAFQTYTVTPTVTIPNPNLLAAVWRINVGPGAYAESLFGKGAYGTAAYGQGGFASASQLAIMEVLSGAAPINIALAGNLQIPPMPDLAGTLVVQPTLAGNLQIMEALSGATPINVALAGRLSELQAFGGAWALNVSFAGNLQIAPTQDLAGTLVIQPTLAGNLLTSSVNLAGRLDINPSFAGALSEVQAIAGAWSLSVSFAQAQMGLQTSLGGSWTLSVDIGLPDDVKVLIGPLWGVDAPCPPPLWTTSTLCPDPPWAPETGYLPSIYNVGPYGVAHYGRGDYAPAGATSAPPSVWTPSEMCHA